jgi:DNA-binding winged helix-turn-helix (wHTH) protein
MLHKEFLSGHYQNTITSFFEEQNSNISRADLPSLVGSLSFTGRIFEAEKLFFQNSRDIDLEERSACLFFLGLGHTRKSKYPKARLIFKENQKTLNINSTALQKFYVYQGIAFYLFFIGKLELALKWTNKAFENAVTSKNLYARSLATDLLGHIKLRLGEINLGIDSLKQAAELSRRLGNKSISESVEIAELQYRAQYGYSRDAIFQELLSKFSNITTEDSYSRAVVGLELSRQLTLRGQYAHCEEILEKISTGIFSSENRRQEILLNLRFAENYYQRGRESQAWNYLRSARRCLDFEADKSFEIQILGFEAKLFKDAKNTEIISQLLACTKSFNSVLNQNILKRQSLLDVETYNHEDLFHEFLISLENDSNPIKKIISSSYWSLLYKYIDVPRGKDCLYINLKKSSIIIFSDKKIDIPTGGLTPLDLKLLLNIVNGSSSKEELCKMVWGYEYDSYRHDMMIYTALSSLRKNLASASSWIETTENGYAFNNDKIFKTEDSLTPVSEKIEMSDERKVILKLSSDLNLRQIKTLSHLKKHEAIDVSEYKAIFKISDITASRDLRALKKNGLVISIGKARATKYMLSGSHYEN